MSESTNKKALPCRGIAVLVLIIFLSACRVFPPSAQEREHWHLGAEMPKPFGELATTTVPAEGGEQLVVLSGIAGWGRVVDDVLLYDPVSGEWREGPSLPEARHHASATVLEGAVVIAGGAESLSGHPWEPKDEVWRWQPGDDDWEAMPSLPEARWGHRLVEHDGRLYLVGGYGETGRTWVYHPDQQQWREAAALPEPRDHLSVVVVDDEIWAIGGRAPQSMTRVDIYDPASDDWRAGPDLPEPTSGAAEGVVDGRIYILGGEEPAFWGGGVFDRHWVLSTRAEEPQWQPAPSPPLAVHGADGAVLDGNLVIAGGAGRHGVLSITAWSEAFQILEAPPPNPEGVTQ